MQKFKSRVKRMGWAPELPSMKDYKFSDSKAASVELEAESFDRRAENPPVRDQGQLGSCVGFSSTYGVGWLRRHDRDKLSTVYSPLQLYYDARVRDGMEWAKVDSGAYIRDAMDSLRDAGVAPESSWKYLPKKFSTKPTASVYKAAAHWKLGAHWRCETIEDMMRAISAGFALVGGITCYASIDSDEVSRTGRLPMPARNEEVVGGHALYFDRYNQSDRLFRFLNSWGEDWGDGGYGYIPFDYLANRELADDFWAMEVESPETTPWKD